MPLDFIRSSMDGPATNVSRPILGLFITLVVVALNEEMEIGRGRMNIQMEEARRVE